MTRDPAQDLRAIAFCLERALEPSYRVRAFRTAAAVVDRTPADELADRARSGRLTELSGIGKVTALVVAESLAGEEPVYLRRVQTLGDTPVSEGAAALRSALRGDCHTHSDCRDCGSLTYRRPLYRLSRRTAPSAATRHAQRWRTATRTRGAGQRVAALLLGS